jgi:enoyl-CoA hydratase
MDFNSYKAILFRREGNVLHVTMNRPETLNAFDEDLDTDFARLFTDITNDPETDVVVLTGAGRAFSAGGDIGHMEHLLEHPEEFGEGAMRAKQIVFSMLDCPKPIIAKVNGHAVGLGATVALYSDIIFASENAKFGDPHVKVGFAAGDGGAIIWPQHAGYAKAKHYLLTGDLVPAPEAERIGLITFVVPPEKLDEAVDTYAKRLASGATKAIQWTKMSVNIGLKQLAHTMMDTSIAYENLSNYTQDHAEAVRAFREKRPPKFTGK